MANHSASSVSSLKTSGLAEPAPILQLFAESPLLAAATG